MTESVPAWTLWIPAIAAIGSSIVTAFVVLWTARQNRKTEEKKHLRGLLFNTAIENWKTRMGIIKDLGGSVMPIDSFIIHMLKLSEILNEDITKENILKKIKEIREIVDAMEATYKELRDKSIQPVNSADRQ
jgi:O-acetylhomoserine/O-acetylserine sulfhydrylase-like pyridoxal-dependent enzyme